MRVVNTALLKKHREQNKLTQQQVARYLHMDRSTYAYYELGQSKPTIELLLGLSRLYKIRLNELIEEAPAEPSLEYSKTLISQLSLEEKKLVLLSRSISSEQRKTLLAQIEILAQ